MTKECDWKKNNYSCTEVQEVNRTERATTVIRTTVKTRSRQHTLYTDTVDAWLNNAIHLPLYILSENRERERKRDEGSRLLQSISSIRIQLEIKGKSH